ncbi:MAG TPA: Rieske (2Fe-2S) protein [Polyangiaceae bacterium]|nr:Rieske (2Fe-2S) protein [Polyangiaceae bacterium]
MKQKRRVFLKVIATGPLVGCAGADPGGAFGDGGSSSLAGGGNVTGNPAGGAASSGGSGSSQAGSASTQAGSASSQAGTFSSSTGGLPHFGDSGGTGTTSGGGAAAGTMSTGAGGTGAISQTPGEVVGNVSQLPVGAFMTLSGPYFFTRDAAGIRAMSMQCTHKFCSLVISGNELDCPCHHSRFDREGKVLAGPATTPLPYFKVYVDAAGTISVDKYTLVPASTRTPV